MSLPAIEREIRPPSGANLASVEYTNPLIGGYIALRSFRDRIRTTLTEILSQPLTSPSSPLRDEEYPTEDDNNRAVEAAENPKPRWLRLTSSRWALPTFLMGTTASLAFACAQEQNRPAFVEPAAAAPAETPTSVPQPTSTVEATKPTPTPDIKKIDAFKYPLLPPELQDTAELINFKNKVGNWVTILAWKEVDGKLPITAPGVGSFSRNLDDEHKSSLDVDTDLYRITINLYGDLVYPTTNIAYKIEPGQERIVANTGKTGYKRDWGPEKFALVIGASATPGEGSPPPEEILRQFSQKAFEKPARIVEAEYDPNPNITSAISVSPKR